jgi:hypothetical protein
MQKYYLAFSLTAITNESLKLEYDFYKDTL